MEFYTEEHGVAQTIFSPWFFILYFRIDIFRKEVYSKHMGIFDRLGTVLKSYLFDDDTLYRERRGAGADPDLNAAYDELNDYLNGEKSAKEKSEKDSSAKDSKQEKPNSSGAWAGGEQKKKPVPEALRADFAELGVAFGASADECKEAYKKLLKIHHPDRHANHAGNFKKATDKSARINAAYDRIEQWRSGN